MTFAPEAVRNCGRSDCYYCVRCHGCTHFCSCNSSRRPMRSGNGNATAAAPLAGLASGRDNAAALEPDDDYELEDDPAPGRAVGLVYADTVTVQRIHWLWYGRIPFGKPCGLVGLPDVGKDVIAADIAARLSVGKPMPDGAHDLREPRPTYYLSAEDALEDTILPRFLAAGGDRRY